jgi:hypothetical protein
VYLIYPGPVYIPELQEKHYLQSVQSWATKDYHSRNKDNQKPNQE